MPVLVLTGEKASNMGLIEQARLVASNVRGVAIPDTGHWLLDESPRQTIEELLMFLDGKRDDQRRLSPAEIEGLPRDTKSTATSGTSGIETILLRGNPDRAGPYTIEIHIPAHTKIGAHVDPDERVATVVSGTWYFGYGARFDEAQLKPLAPGSYYTEPARTAHFAETRDTAVVVQLSGDGPSGMTPVAR